MKKPTGTGTCETFTAAGCVCVCGDDYEFKYKKQIFYTQQLYCCTSITISYIVNTTATISN